MNARASTLGLPLQDCIAKGLIDIQQIDPAEMAPGEFASAVRESVEAKGAAVVIIDSLNGYLNAMPDERFLILQMHELLSYLSSAWGFDHSNFGAAWLGGANGYTAGH